MVSAGHLLVRAAVAAPRSPQISGSPHTSNARPARSGSSYGPKRPHRPLRHACRPARTAERHKRRSNGPSAAATAEDRTDRTRSARMTGSPPKLPAPTRPPNSSRSCIRRTADKLSRSHQLSSPKDLLCRPARNHHSTEHSTITAGDIFHHVEIHTVLIHL